MTYDNSNLGRDTKVKWNGEYIGDIYSMGDTKPTREVIDITPYGADDKKYATGTRDPGTLDLEIGDGGMGDQRLNDAFDNHKSGELTLEFPSGRSMRTEALVTSIGTSTKINDVVRTMVSFQLSGTPKYGTTVLITGPTTVERGAGVQLTANGPVTWAIVTPTTDPATTISPDGYLIYGIDETAPKITVEASTPTGDRKRYDIIASHEDMRIIPERLTIYPGETCMLRATQPAKHWSLISEHDADTTIDALGNLQIGAAETVNDVWIRCDSTYDEHAFANARIEKR